MPVFISHLNSNCKNCDIYVDKRSEMNSIEMFRNVCNEKSPFNHASVVLMFENTSYFCVHVVKTFLRIIILIFIIGFKKRK